MSESKAGHWYAYVAWRGWNRTGLGVAFYDDQGKLAGSRFAGVDDAIRRGDLPDSSLARGIDPHVPEVHEDMERTMETIANAMSMAHWEGPMATLIWDENIIDRTFRYVTAGDA